MLVAEMLLHLMSEPQRKQVDCITKAIYHEARGEPERGQIAVASVVLNRTNSKFFPTTACAVVYEAKQFSNIKHAVFDHSSEAWTKAVKIAVLTYTGYIDDPTNGAVFFHNPKKAKKPKSFTTLLAKIGNHDFYS